MTSGLSFSSLHVQDGQTALYIASRKGHDQIVELLLKREAEVNHQTNVRLLMLVGVPAHSIPYCSKQAPMNTCSLSEKNKGWALAQRKCLIGCLCLLSAHISYTDISVLLGQTCQAVG